MLTTIREKAQGAFAWLILIAITIPFALWGIQNYIDTGKESPVASVGDKDFYQRDVNKAYEQFAQNFRGSNIDEQLLKAQALDKLVKDEVLLQYAHEKGLVTSDTSARDFIRALPYFQTDNKFDEKRYKSLLASQKMSSTEFVNKIKSALVMDQLQKSVIDSSFATTQAVDAFFKIQNQQRDIDYVTIPVEKNISQPTDQEIADYYQKHQDSYKVPEQVSIEYVELSLDDLAKEVVISDDKLQTFYEEQKEQYTKPEERRISHILFAAKTGADEKVALEKVSKAQEALKTKDFAVLAGEVSDDKLSAKKGGDLGLFIPGSMDKSFEEAVKALKPGEVSKPVKTAFGYHLIKLVQFTPSDVKPFDAVKADLSKRYQKSQAEDAFYAAGDKLSQLSYENPDNLQSVSENLKLPIKKTGLFNKEKGEGIAAEAKVREMAFSEEVLKGNNSTPVEITTEHIVVLRVLEHKPATVRDLASVKAEVTTALLNEKSKQLTADKAAKIKAQVQSGESIQKVAADQKLTVQQANGLKRGKSTLPEQLTDAIFKAAKPAEGKTTVIQVAMANGEQTVVSIKKVTPGIMAEDEKKQLNLAKKSIARAFGQAEFNAFIATLQADANVTINKKTGTP